MKKPLYWGLFIESNDAIKASLEKTISHMHVTYGFKKEMPEELLGISTIITVNAYGNNGDNEGYKIKSIPHEERWKSSKHTQ